MAVDQDNVSKILSVLSHKIRRELLLILSDEEECTFTELMNALSVDTGKLSFHMRSLSPFMEQTTGGKYKLNREGETAVRFIRDIEFWSKNAEVNKKVSQLPLAPFQRRAYAFLIDLSLMVLITIILTLPEALFLYAGNVFSLNLLLISLGLTWIYSTLLEGFNGQTLGKRVVRLKVVRIDGKKIAYDHAAVRNFGKAFLLPFDLAVGYSRKDPRYIRYFDKFAGTTVVDLRL
jgi:uncharacterized RDD family membrane protein YckC